MNRTLLLLVGLVSVVAGAMAWARWWVNSVEPAPTASVEPAPMLLPRVEPRAATASDAGVAITQVVPLRESAPVAPALLAPPAAPPAAPPEPPNPEAVAEPPEFRHLRRLRDPAFPRTRLPPPNNPRIQLEPLLRH